jgi:hypothetical protein
MFSQTGTSALNAEEQHERDVKDALAGSVGQMVRQEVEAEARVVLDTRRRDAAGSRLPLPDLINDSVVISLAGHQKRADGLTRKAVRFRVDHDLGTRAISPGHERAAYGRLIEGAAQHLARVLEADEVKAAAEAAKAAKQQAEWNGRIAELERQLEGPGVVVLRDLKAQVTAAAEGERLLSTIALAIRAHKAAEDARSRLARMSGEMRTAPKAAFRLVEDMLSRGHADIPTSLKFIAGVEAPDTSALEVEKAPAGVVEVVRGLEFDAATATSMMSGKG